ncbi:unnamed protein product [Larinioides sclopetarius]|uniref:Uncharacterized protein n=1 Tax=Larinioides sclopetarius TaxID=280406 RepID=A0AAV2B076_9ARAC
MNFLMMLLAVLCFAAIAYVAMADDEPKTVTMTGPGQILKLVTDSDGNVVGSKTIVG